MKKTWFVRAFVMLGIMALIGFGTIDPFAMSTAHADSPTCGSPSTTFDMSGAWTLNYTVDTFTGSYDHHQSLTFTKQTDGTFLATSTAMGSMSAVAFSVNRAPTTSGDVCLLTSIAITQDHPSTTYHAIWSGFELYDISGAHPVDTGKISGDWSDLMLNKGLFELDR